MEEGIEKGYVCNRNGCEAILDEHEKEGCCSCHINPPCGYCMLDTTFCPLCGWDAEEERMEYENNNPPESYQPMFKIKTLDDLDDSKVDWISESHTHFSMKKRGVYPKDWDNQKAIGEILAAGVRGSWGGRFSYIGGGRFTYVAYTD